MNGPRLGDELYTFGPFRLDVRNRVLLHGEDIEALPPKAVETLIVLVQNSGVVVDKETLLRTVWPGTFVGEDSLSHNISVLRKVLAKRTNGKALIETAPKRGYRFVGEVLPPGMLGRGGRRSAFKPTAVSTAILLVLVAGLTLLKHRYGQREELTTRVRPLTAYRGTQAFPAFSPDGLRVAFVWNGEKQEQFDIYVKRLDTEAPARLTWDAPNECYTAWSPDGRYIAFVHCAPWSAPGRSERGASIYMIAAGGGPKRKVTELCCHFEVLARPLTWGGDAKSMVIAEYQRGDSVPSLFLLSLDSGTRKRLTTAPPGSMGDWNPAVSPDGRMLAFVRGAAFGSADIYLLDMQTGDKPRRLTFVNDFVSDVVWVSGAREILFKRGREATGGLWRVSVTAAAEPKLISTVSQPGVQVAASLDGTKLAYSRRYTDFNIFKLPIGPEASGAKPVRFIASTLMDAEPQFSPDGRYIAFHSDRSGTTEIWASNADGSAPSQLTSLGEESGSPAWSPDGRQVAFDARVNANLDIYTVDIATRKVRRLTTHPASDNVPAWSRDGAWVYFSSKRTGRHEVWKIPAYGGQEVRVTKGGGFFAVEAADRKHLYYAKEGNYPTELWQLSFETGEEQRIIEELRYWSYFAPFEDGVYFIPTLSPQATFRSFTLQFLEFATRRVRLIAGADMWPGIGFAISPDRRELLIAPAELEGANLALVENFK
jgi:Tol biopolymer transport system component/DNA-binding winged helix-turn-helix (wHTH) protein